LLKLILFRIWYTLPGRLSRQAGQHLRVNADEGQPALAAVLDGQGVVLQIFFEPAGENRDEL
jgi:hypothetical protein